MTITPEQLKRRLQRVKKKLKKLHIWNMGYLEEAVDNQLRLKLNDLSNQKDEAQIKFLLRNGMAWDDIIAEAVRTKKVIRNFAVAYEKSGGLMKNYTSSSTYNYKKERQMATGKYVEKKRKRKKHK